MRSKQNTNTLYQRTAITSTDERPSDVHAVFIRKSFEIPRKHAAATQSRK